MIKLNKKADIALIDIAMMLIFALIGIIFIILFSVLGNPFDRNAEPKENYGAIYSATALNGLLASQIENNNAPISFAEYIRLNDLNNKDVKAKIGRFIEKELAYQGKPFPDADPGDPKLPVYYIKITKSSSEIEFGYYQGAIITNKKTITQTIPGYGKDIVVEFGLLGYYTKKELGTFK